MFNTDTITIINRLKASDNPTKRDEYHKTVLQGCAWYSKAVSSVQGTTVSMGNTFRVLIPFDDRYKPYSEWKNATDGYYTMSAGDIIIKGEVAEEVTNESITRLKQAYMPFVCEVKSVDYKQDRGMPSIEYQLACEGV